MAKFTVGQVIRDPVDEEVVRILEDLGDRYHVQVVVAANEGPLVGQGYHLYYRHAERFLLEEWFVIDAMIKLYETD